MFGCSDIFEVTAVGLNSMLSIYSELRVIVEFFNFAEGGQN